MQEIIHILNELRSLSGNKQLNKLKEYKDNELLKEILLYTYDQSLKYKISDNKLKKGLEVVKNESGVECCDWITFKNMLDKLSKLKATKDSDVFEVANFIDSCETQDEIDLYTGVLLKDLRLGLNKSTINKAFGGDTIEKEYVMLAKEYDEKDIVINPRYSRKMDGIRCWVSDGIAYSRKNKVFPTANIQHILNAVGELSKEYVLDGELIYIDDNGIESFKKTTNYIKKDELKEGWENIRYVVFYMVKKDEWFNRKSSISLLDSGMARVGDMNINKGYSETLYDNVYSLNQFLEKDLPQLQENRKKYNWEGIMVLCSSVPYQFKRTNALQKMKEFQDAEFDIVDFKIGSNKYSDTLGSITIKLDCGSLVDVGSGFSDDERNLIWNNRNVILADKDVKLKVRYFEKTSNQKGGNGLRFPTFKGFRKDMEEWIING